MRVLFIDNGIHIKNRNALLMYKNVVFCIVTNANIQNIDISQFDAIYSPCSPVDVSKYPNSKFIFGPHFSVFPEQQHMNIIKQSKNVIYVQPSDWVRDLWINNSLCNGIRIETLPFGVDTDKFNEVKPSSERNKVFVYYKSRQPNELQFILNFLNNKNIEVVVFDYINRYSENEYLKYLQESKYGIWIGRHESQGFALEEALSCNVPLFVWDVTSMNQEYGYSYSDIPATCIPYWDNSCGEVFVKTSEIDDKFKYFNENLTNYKPREYILKNLSVEKCEEKFINIITPTKKKNETC